MKKFICLGYENKLRKANLERKSDATNIFQ